MTGQQEIAELGIKTIKDIRNDWKKALGHKNVSREYLKCFYEIKETHFEDLRGRRVLDYKEKVDFRKINTRTDSYFKESIDKDFYLKTRGMNKFEIQTIRRAYIKKAISYLISYSVNSKDLEFTNQEIKFMKEKAGLPA